MDQTSRTDEKDPVEGLPAAPTEPADHLAAWCDPTGRPRGPLERARQAAVGVLARGVDGLYVAFQGALKFGGLLPAENGPAPEEGVGADRHAVLPRREGRWPVLRIRLPASAVYAFSVDGLFRRSALWRSWDDEGELLRDLGSAVREVGPEVVESDDGQVTRFVFHAGGVENLVKLSPMPDGGCMIGVSQKIHRLRFDEAERLLNGPRGDLPDS